MQLTLSDKIKHEFQRSVIELFNINLNIVAVPAAIEQLRKNSIVNDNGFYSELIHAVPNHRVGCEFHPGKRDAIYSYCKSKLEVEINNEAKQEVDLTLKEIVKPIYYNSLLQQLVNGNFITRETYCWGDTYPKGLAAALLKDLQKKGYYKENRTLTKDEILIIVKNTFRIDVSKSTARAKPTDYTRFLKQIKAVGIED